MFLQKLYSINFIFDKRKNVVEICCEMSYILGNYCGGKVVANIIDITEEQAKIELEKIAKEMAKADIAYYQNDEPYLTDAEYDALKQRNIELEKAFPHLIRDDSPSKKIGAPLQSGFGKVRHIFPMLSLGDVFSIEEAEDFVAGVKRFLNTEKHPGVHCTFF